MKIQPISQQVALAVVALALMQSSAMCIGFEVYSDRELWRAAAGGGIGNLTEDFNSFVENADFSTVDVQAGFLTFSSPIGDGGFFLIATSQATSGLPSVNGSGFAALRAAETTVLFEPLRVAETLVEFEPVSAIGFDYRNGLNAGLPGNLPVTTSLGDELVLPDTATTKFFGLVYQDGTTIDSLRFSAGGANLVYSSDDWEAFASTTPVPEPGAFILAAAGVVALVVASWKVPRPQSFV